MGCDIHATLEYDKFYIKYKEKKKDWWGFAKSIDIDRSYYFFTILNGVRDIGLRPIIAKDRGVPKDASFEFREELEDANGDAHSPSYVSFKELKEWKPENPEIVEFDPTEFRQEDFYQTMELLAKKYGDENVRLVFFYDN